MKKSTFLKIYVIPMLILSPFMAMSCNHWFSIWMIMELNLMTFSTMIIFYNKFFKENSFKYFIIQTLSSSMMLFSSNPILINLNVNMLLPLMINMINMTMFMKLGLTPFHNWFIKIMNNLNWMNCFILSTWQKTIPIIIISYIFSYKLIMLIIMLTSFISSIFSLNHVSIRIMLSYSSLNHISWIMMNLFVNDSSWFTYFSSYMTINMSLMMIFNKFKIFYLNQLTMINNKYINMFIIINLLSMSGMPPMFGFMMKWMTIYYAIYNNLFLIMTMITLMSIITFILYTRMSLLSMLMYYSNNKIMIFNKFKNLNNMKLYIMLIINFNLNLWIMSLWMI